MNMNIRKRLEQLEARFGGHSDLILTMPDGAKHCWSLGRSADGIFALWNEVARDPHSEKAELIRNCIDIQTPNDGHMGELIHVFLLSGDASPEIFEQNQPGFAGWNDESQKETEVQ